MQLGPNMKRLREMDVSDSVKACVITGPGDLMTWEVSACVDSEGIRLEVIGRGSDLEAAAGSAMAVLTENGASLDPSAESTEMLTVTGGDAAFAVPEGDAAI